MLLIQDTARNNLISWTTTCLNNGWAQGAVLSPFTTPVHKTSYKAGASEVATSITAKGGQIWFDPTTHAINMPGVGDYRYYQDWNLWPSAYGDLSSDGACRDHIKRVFDIQDNLGAQKLAPTILLVNPQGAASSLALKMAQIAMEIDEECFIPIAGDVHFWSSSDDLDAHIGALAQLEPKGWFITVTRVRPDTPVTATKAETFGLMRTVRSLSEDGFVHVSSGDLAGIPAIAAGAKSLGTGWDTRQRACAYSDYAARLAKADGGQWYKRPTLFKLMGILHINEYEVLRAGNPDLARRLLPGELSPGPTDAFNHHVKHLAKLVNSLSALDYKDSYNELTKLYRSASREWDGLARIIVTEFTKKHWIEPYQDGLALYGKEEGW